MKEESLQAENILFFRNLDTCCQKIAERIENKDITSWKNSDYIRLSGLLYRKTKVHLGENTLKRIFGKVKTSTRYYPQKATRDALAQFIDFRDWQEFERINSAKLEIIKLSMPPTDEVSKGISSKAKITLGIISLAIVMVIGITFWIYVLSTVNDNEIELRCLNPTGQSPHSALFSIVAKNKAKVKLSEYQINFADKNEKKVKFTESLVTHYYEAPGRYFPVLYHNSKPIDTTAVYLQTAGWDLTASVEHDTTRVYPVNQIPELKAKTLSTSTIDLKRAGVDTTKTFFISFSNIKPTAISADNFELNVFLKTSPARPGVRCSQADIIILGEKNYHYINLIKPECVVWSTLKFSEQNQDGTKNDLRSQGQDLRNGKQIRLKIQQRYVRLFIGDIEIFHTRYRKPIGKLMGVKINFAGTGSFENFELHDLRSKVSF